MPSLVVSHCGKEHQLLAFRCERKICRATVHGCISMQRGVGGGLTSSPTVSLGPLGKGKLFVSRVGRRSHDGGRGREGSAVLSELVGEGKGSFKAGSSLSLDSTHTYTHTYCPGVSATAD